MKFSVSKDKLLEGLSTVQNVVSTRTTFPILSNVLLGLRAISTKSLEEQWQLLGTLEVQICGVVGQRR